VASALGLCPHFSVEDYYFPVDDVQQYHIAHFTIGIIFHGNDTLRYKISSKQ
jgi:hypothetical protein